MPESTFDEELKAAFRALDEDRMIELSRRSPYPLAEMSDAGRLGLAFGLLAAGRTAQADGVLATVQGDGSAPLADFGFVRAFRHTVDNNHAAAIQAMAHLLDDPRATHGSMMRLRLADSLIKLGNHDQLRQVLAPFLQPPGNDHTLEAALIIVDSMIRNKIRGDAMIEQVALIDILLERGFRLTKVENVVFYAELLHNNSVEGVVGNMLGSHADLLDRYIPTEPVEIEFLLTAGDKYKVPAAVRSAGEGYARHPFKFAKVEAESASYLFSAHEQHRAAREVIPAHFSRNAIRKDPALVRSMMILNYYAQEWKEALELIRDNREALRDRELYEEAMRMRASCEYHLGRYSECLDTAKTLGGNVVGDSPQATAAEALASLALNRPEAFAAAVNRVLAARKYDDETLMHYFSEIVHEVALHEQRIGILTAFLRTQPKKNSMSVLDMIADQSVRFSWFDGMDAVSGEYEAHGERIKSLYFKGLRLVEQGREADALAVADDIASDANDRAGIGRTLKATVLRRFRRYEEALGVCEELLASLPQSFTTHGIRIGILNQLGRPKEEVEAAQNAAMNAINQRSRSREEFDFLRNRVAAAAYSDEVANKVTQMRKLAANDFDAVETLRLARVVGRSFDAEEASRAEASALQAQWIAKNQVAWEGGES
ncbi:hypothetical protein IT571_00575 [Candidatus Sumerlaeota bacterium]|nr:hypothetical protein [Candidatus Sumerlaeota bacterium]